MRDHFLGDPTRVTSDACGVQAGCSVEPAKLLNDSLSYIRFLKTVPSLNDAASLASIDRVLQRKIFEAPGVQIFRWKISART